MQNQADSQGEDATNARQGDQMEESGRSAFAASSSGEEPAGDTFNLLESLSETERLREEQSAIERMQRMQQKVLSRAARRDARSASIFSTPSAPLFDILWEGNGRVYCSMGSLFVSAQRMFVSAEGVCCSMEC